MTDSISFGHLLIRYLTYLEVERQVSQYTIRNYNHYLKRFVAWLDETHQQQNPGVVTTDLISKYRQYLSRYQDDLGRTLSKVTQSYHVIALRSWFKWMIKQDIEVMPPEKIELPKGESRSLHFLNGDQIERLLNQPRVGTVPGLRDRAILELLFSTGLRVSELVRLNREVVNLDKKEFGVIGKGKKIRLVFLSDRAARWLERYEQTRRDHWEPLFIRYARGKAPITSDGEKMRLTARSVQRLVEKYRKAARLPVPITPHGLRHSFATDLLSHGAGLREVQEMLGHKNVSTTQIYTHVTNPQLRAVHQKFHSGNKEN
jgi:site-specific recombinase XerD